MLEEVGLSSQERRMCEDVFGGIFARFVEPVHIELSNKAVDVSVSEENRQDLLLELSDVYNDEFPAVVHPVYG